MADAIVADEATPPEKEVPFEPLTPERQAIALEASWELYEMAITLAHELKRPGREHDPLQYRPFAARVKELAGALISALDDPNVATDELDECVRVVADEMK